ncbi:hypothetical protein AVEN_215632-1 [Araneus ventricosus]|uniref:Mos1 transposase HTH domain-containing protein n=1 Tax=Araneus ventricosus TaxID=182803 RepID=A0A4Y2QD73_ARAVE|nr:hypothetical protein AVEN_215632-1 [Araneus ventricosus]
MSLALPLYHLLKFQPPMYLRSAVTLATSVQKEQRVNLKFVFKFRKILNLFALATSAQCLSRTQILDWFKRFKENREMIDDGPSPRLPIST